MSERSSDPNERTRDIYEQNPAYPKPPLVPLPTEDEFETFLAENGQKRGSLARRVTDLAFGLTGFRKFFKNQLPSQLEDLLRGCDLRGGGLFAPVISATLALENDPRPLSPFERAATLLFGLRSFYDDLASGRFPPDTYRDQALEMGQYPNFFSTSLVVEPERARLFKSKLTSQIAVAVGGRLYIQQVGNLGSETSFAQLVAALEALAQRGRENPLRAGEPSPGLLTCGSNNTQRRAFLRMQQSEVNRRSLHALRHCFVTLCLDLDDQPATPAEAALIAQSRNPENRWFPSSTQLIVFGNGAACALCAFSAYLDGNTMMRGVAEIHQRAAACSLEDMRPSGLQQGTPLPPAEELKWQINPQAVAQAHRDLGSVLDDQTATFEIEGVGRDFFKAHGVEAVPAFILALQMTANRLTGAAPRITQFMTMSRYRCMDLTTAVVSTPEVLKFAETMAGEGAPPVQALALLHQAIDSQSQALRKARRHLAIPEIYLLFLCSKQGFSRRYAGAILNLRLLLLQRMGALRGAQRQILVSHPEIFPQIPVVGRPGIRLPYVTHFGLHYQIWPEKTVITMMPGVSWKTPNAELIATLERSLRQVQEVLGKPG